MESSAPMLAFQPYRFALGSLVCTVLSDGPFYFPAAFDAATALPRDLDRALADARLATDQPLSYHQNILLIETGGQLVLVDTGFNGAQPGTGQLLPSLRAAGVAPADITTVVLTHAHPDHILGLLGADGRPVFAAARHVMARPEWDFWATDPSLGELAIDAATREQFRAAPRAVLPAIRDRLELVDFGGEVAPGIVALAAPGHTPGHMALEITSGGERLLHLVDAATHPVLHLRHTDWFSPVDNWPAHSVPTRRRLLDRAAEERPLVLGYHFEFPGLGWVVRHGEADWRWEPIAAQSQT